MIQTTVENINKERALEYLQLNTGNYRSMNLRIAKTYAEDMKAGKWVLNGEPIVFDQNGKLKDGQHRLMAVTIADAVVPFLVVRGVENDVNIFDFGSNRNIRQVCSAMNAPVKSCCASASRILLFGFHGSAVKGVQADYILAHKDELHEAQRIAMKGRKKALGEKASVVLFVYVCRKLKLFSDELMEDFFWTFNNQSINADQARDPSPALIAARMFIEKYPTGSASVQIKHINILYQAIRDFKANRNRLKEYKFDAVDFMPYINAVRRQEGIRETNS